MTGSVAFVWMELLYAEQLAHECNCIVNDWWHQFYLVPPLHLLPWVKYYNYNSLIDVPLPNKEYLFVASAARGWSAMIALLMICPSSVNPLFCPKQPSAAGDTPKVTGPIYFFFSRGESFEEIMHDVSIFLIMSVMSVKADRKQAAV